MATTKTPRVTDEQSAHSEEQPVQMVTDFAKPLQSIAKPDSVVIAKCEHAGVTYQPGDTIKFTDDADREYHEQAGSIKPQ